MVVVRVTSVMKLLEPCEATDYPSARDSCIRTPSHLVMQHASQGVLGLDILGLECFEISKSEYSASLIELLNHYDNVQTNVFSMCDRHTVTCIVYCARELRS